MITFSKLGKHGNLGNQLFQVAALIGLSEKFDCEMLLPEWKYAKYFQHALPKGDTSTDLLIEEKAYHYQPEYWDSYREVFRTKNTDILGWLQSEKYWQDCKEKVITAFTFKEEFARRTREKFRSVFQKKTIAISIRRGDFVTNPNFYLLPMEYYMGALVHFFPGYKNRNIIIFSDDLSYCRLHIKPLRNIYFAVGLNDAEQLCLMQMCDDFIISNSSFSWWGALLGEKKDTVTVRSPYQLEGELFKKFNTRDYYPERWLVYDHLGKEAKPSNLISSAGRLQYYRLQNYCYSKWKRISNKMKTHQRS